MHTAQFYVNYKSELLVLIVRTNILRTTIFWLLITIIAWGLMLLYLPEQIDKIIKDIDVDKFIENVTTDRIHLEDITEIEYTTTLTMDFYDVEINDSEDITKDINENSSDLNVKEINKDKDASTDNVSSTHSDTKSSTKATTDKQTNERSDKGPRDIRSPLDQFSVIDFVLISLPILGAIELSFTNMTLNIGISTSTYSSVNILPLLWEKIVTSKWFTSIVSLYHTVFNLVKSQINVILNNNFLPFFLCLFVYILTNNLIGMIPYTLAPTSHFILTFFISFSLVIGVTILGFMIHKLFFFSLLVPSGCPLGLLPLLVLIETISYLARSVSLGLRLAANILSGHMLLNILSEFTYKIMNTNTIYFILAMIPLIFIGGFSGLELGIAFIQSQVFVVLGSSYTKDSVQLH